jgi:hypothetical protein
MGGEGGLPGKRVKPKKHPIVRFCEPIKDWRGNLILFIISKSILVGQPFLADNFLIAAEATVLPVETQMTDLAPLPKFLVGQPFLADNFLNQNERGSNGDCVACR